MSANKWEKEIDRVVERTATKITEAMDKLVIYLPEGAAPQMAMEQVVRKLTGSQPWFMALIMEDHDFREAYANAVAARPATARKRPPR